MLDNLERGRERRGGIEREKRERREKKERDREFSDGSQEIAGMRF